MTTAEIKALVAQRRAVKIPATADGCYNYDDPLCAAIETLLARQAEVLEEIMFDYSLHSENVRAILNPENET